jgi:TolB-like protein/tetratricopeptide (TPR) repeat protein
VFLLLALGFPLALFFAWAYELTPEGLKREHDVDRSQSIVSQTGRRIDFLIIGVLVVAIGMLLVEKFLLPEAEETAGLVAEDAAATLDATPSIAVLPFVNMSADESSVYFSDGLADTVLHMLAQVSELRVAARTSSFQFRGQSMDVSKIGEQLNVGTILEGSVQKAGNKIRVTAQLINVSDGFHLWSGNFDRELDDVFAIQDEIAREVVSALASSLLPARSEGMRQGGTDNVDAYTEVLLAIHELDSHTFDSLDKALGHLRTATEIDPDYVRAHALISQTYMMLAETGAMSEKDGNEAAYRSANKALDLAPTSSHALSAMGIAELRAGNDEVAGDLLRRAMEYGPNDTTALQNYARYLIAQRKPREAFEILRDARRLDPLSAELLMFLSMYSRSIRDFEAAESYYSKINDINPSSPYGYMEAARAQSSQGQRATAIVNWKKTVEIDPDDPELMIAVANGYMALGMFDEVNRWANRAAEVDPDHPASQTALIYYQIIEHGTSQATNEAARRIIGEAINGEIEVRGYSALSMTQMLSWGLHEEGRDQTEVLDMLDNLFPHLFDEPPTDTDKNWEETRIVGQIMITAGRRRQGLALLDAWSEETAQTEVVYGPNLDTVEVALARGNTDEALDRLHKMRDLTYSDSSFLYIFERDPLYRQIANEPQVIELIKEHQANVVKQRALLIELESGDAGEESAR